MVDFSLFSFLYRPSSHFSIFIYDAVIVMDQYTRSGFHYHFSQNDFEMDLEPVWIYLAFLLAYRRETMHIV